MEYPANIRARSQESQSKVWEKSGQGPGKVWRRGKSQGETHPGGANSKEFRERQFQVELNPGRHHLQGEPSPGRTKYKESQVWEEKSQGRAMSEERQVHRELNPRRIKSRKSQVQGEPSLGKANVGKSQVWREPSLEGTKSKRAKLRRA